MGLCACGLKKQKGRDEKLDRAIQRGAEDGKMRSVFVTRWVHMACWLVCEWPSSISALMVGLIGKGAEWCGTARGHIKLLIVIYHPPRLLVSSHSCLPEAPQSERKGFGLERCVGVPRYTGG